MELVLELLTELFETGLGYSGLNTARSALSSFISIGNVPVRQIPIVRRFLKGVFDLRPALPKNNSTWDVCTVLNFLKNVSQSGTLNLKSLTLKTCVLLALVTCQRRQTLHAM